MNYRADIDALRAIAVLSVILFHLGTPGFSGGFVGVDVFFVISGYVIAKGLEEDLQQERFSIWRFYNKRIRRIFPALFATLLVTWIAAYFILLPNYFENFSETLTASSAFAANIYFWKTQNYFSPEAITRPLNHIWSLSLEEQYYIFAPVLTFFIFCYCKQKWRTVLLPILLLSLGLSIYMLPINPVADFFLLPTRAWEFIVGALLAHASPPPIRAGWLKDSIGLFGLVLIGFTVTAFTENTSFPGTTALIPCLGTAMVIYTGQSSGLSTKLLSLRPLPDIGKISYSLYLIHWPIIVFSYFILMRMPDIKEGICIVGLGMTLAALSWRFIEQPFRRPNMGLYPKRVFIGGLTAALLFCALGTVGVQNGGLPSRFPDFQYRYGQDYRSWRMEVCYYNDKPKPLEWDAENCALTNAGQHKVLLWGDSEAAHYAPGLMVHKNNIPYTILEYTAGKCPPVLSYSASEAPGCAQFNEHALDIIKAENIDTVILAARWADTDRTERQKLSGTIETLEKLGLKIYVIGQSPRFMMDPQVIAYYKDKLKKPPMNEAETDFDLSLNDELAAMTGRNTFINPMAKMCKGNLCPFRDKSGQILFLDNQHYNQWGSARAVRTYFPLLQPTLAIPTPQQ